MNNIDIKSKMQFDVPFLPPIPVKVTDVKNCSIVLTSVMEANWHFLFEEIVDIPSPYAVEQDYDFDKVAELNWKSVVVPSSLIMQGFDIENNVEYYYKRKFRVPEDYAGNRVFLRFEGVYSNARIWINNKFVQTHIGGFTIWDCDISNFIDTNEVTIVVGVTDVEGRNVGIWNKDGKKISSSSWASYYAHMNIGGIIRNITMFALPQNYVAKCHIDTQLSAPTSATVLIKNQIKCGTKFKNVRLEAKIFDKNSVMVAKESFIESRNKAVLNCVCANHIPFDEDVKNINSTGKSDNNFFKKINANDKKYIDDFIPTHVPSGDYIAANFEIAIDKPILWDAEHPQLYTLKVELYVDDVLTEQNCHAVGIRQITYGGANKSDKNKVYINGSEVKLRGVCRHDVSHLYGRSLTNEDMYEEICAYKNNNINFIRTSHYPASEYMLKICDEIGMYVEQENSACFKGANNFRIYNAPQEFENSFAEMIESGRNHPSIIIWSIANESNFEKTCAFRDAFDYVKKSEPTRSTIFSYPFTVKSTQLPYDIFSKHYENVTTDLGHQDMPILHDEFAHICCYNIAQLTYDNSRRDFWGESIKIAWEGIFNGDGALGCALWGAIDDVFYIPDGTSKRHQKHSKGKCTGYGEWGCVLDAYKRQKTEAYLTKKAFSPIAVNEKTSNISVDMLTLFVANRFDHTNIAEVKMLCVDDKNNVIFDDFVAENIKPHQNGKICISCKNVKKVNVKFYFSNILIDEYNIGGETNTQIIQNNRENCDNLATTSTSNSEINDLVIIDDITLSAISKSKNKIVNNSLNNYDTEIKSVQKRQIKNKKSKSHVTIKFKNIFSYKLEMQQKGQMLVCTLSPKNFFSRFVNMETLQLNLPLAKIASSVNWSKDALYSDYPTDHIGRSIGEAKRVRNEAESRPDVYGKKPQWTWEQDMVNYYLAPENAETNGVATRDFMTRRNNISQYNVNFDDEKSLEVVALIENLNAYVAVKKQNDTLVNTLEITRGCYYPDLQWGNYYGKLHKVENKTVMKFAISLSNKKPL